MSNENGIYIDLLKDTYQLLSTKKKVYMSNENGIYIDLLKDTYQLLSTKQKKNI